MRMTKVQQRNVIFYILYTEYQKTQQEIATFFDVSQGTVSLGIKEATYIKTIQEYEAEIIELKQQLALQMGNPPSGLPPMNM